jgi:hypothetical protein
MDVACLSGNPEEIPSAGIRDEPQFDLGIELRKQSLKHRLGGTSGG